MQNGQPIQVFYDSQCVICDRTINSYKALNQRVAPKANSIVWLDIYKNKDSLRKLGIPFKAAQTELQVVDQCGQITTGVKAHLCMWQEMEQTKLRAKMVKHIPGLYTFADLYYRGFLAYRRLVSRRAKQDIKE